MWAFFLIRNYFTPIKEEKLSHNKLATLQLSLNAVS